MEAGELCSSAFVFSICLYILSKDIDLVIGKSSTLISTRYLFELVLSSAAFKPLANFSGLSTAQKCIMNKRGSSCSM